MNLIDEELIKLDNIMIKYISALKVLETQIEIINDDFKYIIENNKDIESLDISNCDNLINHNPIFLQIFQYTLCPQPPLPKE